MIQNIIISIISITILIRTYIIIYIYANKMPIIFKVIVHLNNALIHFSPKRNASMSVFINIWV